MSWILTNSVQEFSNFDPIVQQAPGKIHLQEMSWMKVMRVAIASMLFASLPALAQMTHEEQTVRATYAKLAYAAKLGVLIQNVLGAPTGNHLLDQPSKLQAQIDAQINFELHSFSVGALTDIAGARWDSLVTKPRGDLIAVETEYTPYRTGSDGSQTVTEMNDLVASWARVNDGPELDWSMPVRRVIADLPLDTLKPQVTYSRYAGYSVSAKLDGRQRTYSALFLFGKNPDGSEAIFPIDHVLGMGSLNFVMEHSIYPQPLLETYVREWPGIREWIATAGIISDSAARDVICNGTTGKCGIPAEVLARALKVPIDPASRQLSPKLRRNSADRAAI